MRIRWRVSMLAAVLAAGPALPGADAATPPTVVSCTGSGDIAAVQAAVDAAVSGDTIQIAGTTCDFTAAAPHGGSVSSIDATAVLVRPAAPVTDLVVEAAPGHTPTILGSGTQTAFAIAPGNDRVTVRGLQFTGLARPIVVLGAEGVTIGAAGGVPAPGGNRILADATADSAVVGVATSTPMSVGYGSGGSLGPVTLTPTSLRDLTVMGNQITYRPAGAVDPTGSRDVVAVDIRQQGTATVQGVDVVANAVGMFGSDLTSFRYNAVRVEGLTPVPASAPPALADYRIREVAVAGNNLGRLEEIDPGRLAGVDPGGEHAAGRVGVLLVRVGEFSVAGNEVRTRLRSTGAGMPGGGIVVSDSGFGSVTGNTVDVGSDAGTPASSDLGHVGVVEGVPALFGGSTSDQATTAVEVRDNAVGAHVESPFVAGRGVVLTGADLATVRGNEVVSHKSPSLLVGADVRGPSGRSLPTHVTRAVACGNRLDGTEDAPSEVSVRGPGHSGNSYPGGASHPGGAQCVPTLAVTPAIPAAVQSTGTLTGAGRAWASRPVGLTVTDEQGATATVTGTADATGAYSLALDSTHLGPLDDGILDVVAIASAAPGFTRSSPAVVARKNFVTDPPPAGTAEILDGDGYTSSLEVTFGTDVSWTAAPHVRPTVVTLTVVDSLGRTPADCGPLLRPASGTERLPYNCLVALAQGTYEVRARWHASDGEQSPDVVDTSEKDTVLPTATISSPGQDAIVTSSSVTVSGTVSEPGTVTIRTPDFPYAVLGTASTTGTTWSTTITLDDGEQSFRAFATDVAGNEGPATAPRAFVVDAPESDDGGPADTTPPDAPVITSPDSGSLRGGSFEMFGTAEPEATIYVFVNGAFKKTTVVSSSGVWGIGITEDSGSKDIHTLAVDAAGNVSSPSNTLTLTVDAAAPELSITTPMDTVFTPLQPMEIEGTASDANDVAAVIVEYWSAADSSGPVATDTATCTPGCPAPSITWKSTSGEPLLPGLYSVRAIAFDRVGNQSAAVVRFFKVR